MPIICLMVRENHKMVREKSGNSVRAHGWTPCPVFLLFFGNIFLFSSYFFWWKNPFFLFFWPTYVLGTLPESSRCWQHHLVDSHFARHAMWFICIDILKIVNCECWNTQQYITFKWDQILSWIYEVISYTRSGTYFREKCSLKWWYHSCWMLKKSETLHK